MGWFRRRDADDSNEFYTGDAPVLMPGVDGQQPTAYVSGGSDFRVTDRTDSLVPPGYPPLGYPTPPGYGSPPNYPGPHPGPPQYGIPGGTERTVRRVGLGCFSIVALFILLSIGLAVFAFFSSFKSSFFSEEAAPTTVVGAVDVPATVQYDNTDIRITVGGAQSQPGGGWGRSSGDTPPNLVIAASIQSTSTDHLTIPFIYWTFTPDDGSAPLTMNIVSGFDPAIVTASLTDGAAEIGYLVFETPATAGTLSLVGDYGDPPLVSWALTAKAATVVTGSEGVPVRGQVGMPPFTVTLDATTWVDPSSVIASKPPATGSYLLADLTLKSTGVASSGIIDHELFVFVPAAGKPVPSVQPGVVQDSTSITSVAGGASTPVRVAFDVPVGPGTLELRDPAGRPMIRWPVP